jgi:hypothetical protein
VEHAPPQPEPATPAPEPEVEAIQSKIEEMVTAVSPLLPADAERVRAAVTIALDAAMPALIDELTAKVLLALRRTEH